MAARSRIALASLFLYLVSAFLLSPILPMAYAQTSQPSGAAFSKKPEARSEVVGRRHSFKPFFPATGASSFFLLPTILKRYD